MDRTDFDITIGLLQNQGNIADHHFYT